MEHEVNAAIDSALTGQPLPPPETARQTWDRVKDKLSEEDQAMWAKMHDSDYDEIQFAEVLLETLKTHAG
jgi:hypothetical protein